MRTQLFADRTTNGSTETVTAQSSKGTFVIFGTWDSATVTIELSSDGSTWIAVTDGALTANGYLAVDMAPGLQFRATLSSAGASTSLSVDLFLGRGI